jgi:putative transposase
MAFGRGRRTLAMDRIRLTYQNVVPFQKIVIMKPDLQNHHRRSIRLPGYDYTQPGAYFITLVAHDRLCLFGAIRNGKTQLNRLGKIARQELRRLAQRFPNIHIDTFVVMPNHIHAIIVIHANPVPAGDGAFPTRVGATHPSQNRFLSGTVDEPIEASSGDNGSPIPSGDGAFPTRVGATHPDQNGSTTGVDRTPTEIMPSDAGSPLPHPGPVPGSLGAIIGQFKSRVTKRLWERPEYSERPVWQRNYYEHIIQDHAEWRRIHDYILTNPSRWDEDRENPEFDRP